MSIEDRITEILDQHSSFDGGAFTWGCTCGIDFHDSDTHNAHVARVLVTELGLTEKEGFAPLQKRHLVRYTTKWMDA